MISLRSISPVARAVGTMGAVAAIVTGVTFANLTSNTVSLTSNTLASATAALKISNDNNNYFDTVPGFTFDKLVPGVQSAPYGFQVKNTGDIPLNITAVIPTNISASTIPSTQISLEINCGSGVVTKTLSELAAPQAVPGSPLAGGGAAWSCTAKATLDAGFTGSGTVVPFQLDFTGTQV